MGRLGDQDAGDELSRAAAPGLGTPHAAQFHKLCSSPANFGSFRPINCESGSRNYARSGRLEPIRSLRENRKRPPIKPEKGAKIRRLDRLSAH